MFLSRDRKYPRRGDTEDQTFFHQRKHKSGHSSD